MLLRNTLYTCSGGEMVDTGDLKSPGLTAVPVRVRPRANQTAMKAGPLNDLGYLLFKGVQAFTGLNPFIFLQVIPSRIIPWRPDNK